MPRRLAAAALCLACICGASVSPRAQQVAPSAQKPKTTGTGAISGVVVEGVTNQPVPGAIVQINASGFVVWTLTDSKGRFVARNLPAGRFSISGRCDGYAPDSGAAIYGLDFSWTLGDNQWISDARIVLWRLGSISGTVVDEIGEPMVGARVRVLVRVPIAGAIQWAVGPMVLTDDRGVYEIAGLRKGSYVVSVPSVQTAVPLELVNSFQPLLPTNPFSPPPQSPPAPGVNIANTRLLADRYLRPPTTDGTQAYPTVFYPGVRSMDQAATVTIADGETRPAINFMMRPVAAVSVSGQLIGPNDAIGNMPIRLMPLGTEALGLGAEQASGLSAPDGSFTLLSVPAGRYTLEAGRVITGLRANAWTRTPGGLGPVSPGIAPNQGGFRTLNSSPEIGPLLYDTLGPLLGDEYIGTAPIVVGSTSVSDVNLMLQRSATMSGRIVREDGSNYSPPATPSSTGISVRADPAVGLGAGVPWSTKVGPDGEFTIVGLRPGDYFLRLYPLNIKSVSAPDGDHTARPFTVTPGGDITGIVATLATSPATVVGSVLDKDGRSIRSAAVILFPADSTLWGIMSPRVRTATFSAGADYRMSTVQAGDYYAIAVDRTRENDWQEPGFFARVAALATRVTVAWGEKRKLNLILQDVSR